MAVSSLVRVFERVSQSLAFSSHLASRSLRKAWSAACAACVSRSIVVSALISSSVSALADVFRSALCRSELIWFLRALEVSS